MDPSRAPRDANEISRHLETAFHRLFHHEHGKAWITRVVAALRDGKPVLPLLEHSRHLFPAFFVPFQGKAMFPVDLRSLITRQMIHPRLAEFCGLCASLETVTSACTARRREPPAGERDMLLCLLEHFLAIFPTEEEFRGWLI